MALPGFVFSACFCRANKSVIQVFCSEANLHGIGRDLPIARGKAMPSPRTTA
ncbi:hypothetical protein [Paraburkholderia sp.]|uniref:hypothetical protein n=1 Tax=Paraburkholderia sp. TaxID=1926495 RepID=UPI0025DACD8B|nr:hypothetical protein [Paraburkholderia sp.]